MRSEPLPLLQSWTFFLSYKRFFFIGKDKIFSFWNGNTFCYLEMWKSFLLLYGFKPNNAKIFANGKFFWHCEMVKILLFQRGTRLKRLSVFKAAHKLTVFAQFYRNLNYKFQFSRTNSSRVIGRGRGSTFELCLTLLSSISTLQIWLST